MKFSSIEKICKENNGIISNQIAKQNGISKQTLIRYKNKNKLFQISPGLFSLNHPLMKDEMWILQQRNKNLVFSGLTALELLNQTTWMPNTIYVNKKPNSKITYKTPDYFSFKNDKNWNVGVIKHKDNFGNTILMHSFERCICDLIKQNVFNDTFDEVINNYKHWEKRNYKKLFNIANILKIKKEVINELFELK